MQGVDALEGKIGEMGEVNLGTIAIACALGYLDFRFSVLEWRRGRSRLAKWAEGFFAHPFMEQTAPTIVSCWGG